MVIQIYQQRLIRQLQKECSGLWTQIGIMITTMTTQMMSLQKDLNDKEDKK